MRSVTMAPNSMATSRKAYMHPSEQKKDMFADLNTGKAISNEEHLGIMLRDDDFLNMMSNEPTEDIKQLWCEMLGKPWISPNASAAKKAHGSGGVLKNRSETETKAG